MTARPPEHLRLDRLPTPIGEALLVTDEAGCLRVFDWTDHEDRALRALRLHYPTLRAEPGVAPREMRDRLCRYFAGELTALAAIAWRTAGTPFQRAVWQALSEIAPGTTLSYGALARRLGCARAVRAVGMANGANPISVVLACHRVIGSDGSLTGYGGGLDRKRWLLRHEGAAFRDRPAQAPLAL
jgi:methylated-DNA-[protein]-cysteine S-methyltransferase